MKDATHHLKHLQKKVLQSVRKETITDTEYLNGKEQSMSQTAVLERDFEQQPQRFNTRRLDRLPNRNRSQIH